MVSHEVSFDDELTDEGVTVIVETSKMYEVRKLKKGNNGLYLYMSTEKMGVTTAAFIPRNQAKKIIKAMKAVLNEE